MKQLKEYPYRHITYIIINKYTSANDNRLTPRNFIAKYNIVGTPKPKEYTTNTAYLTSYNLNM